MNSTEKCGEMTTEIHEKKAEYIWKIKNWKAWLDSSPDFLTSSIFDVKILDTDGHPQVYKFQLLAKPHFTPTGQKCIGFKVLPLDTILPQGSFKFKLVQKSWFLKTFLTRVKWDPILLRDANKTISCLYSHTGRNLTLKCELKIVVATDDTSLPKYSDLFPEN